MRVQCYPNLVEFSMLEICVYLTQGSVKAREKRVRELGEGSLKGRVRIGGKDQIRRLICD